MRFNSLTRHFQARAAYQRRNSRREAICQWRSERAGVVALKENVEPQLAPDLKLVILHSRKSRIDEANAADDFEAFCERDDGEHAFMCDQYLVRHDAGDQEIALVLGSTKQIEVTDVK